MPAWEDAARRLADPALHGGAAPEVIETHTARVFLGPERAWKLRRAVDYGWLDYSTPARRRAAAEVEIERNGATAPGLYLGLAGVLDGRLIPPGDTVPAEAEPVVAMRRFAAADLFDRMAEEGRLDAPLMHATGLAIAAMHRAAPAIDSRPRLPEIVTRETGELARLARRLDPQAIGRIAGLMKAELAARQGDLAGRSVRICHGDLHLRNIVLWQGRPAPFDCIDFNEEFARIDPLYDLAFLLMDLGHRGRADLGAATLSAWIEGMGREPGAETSVALDGLGLLPLYAACRAAIRAKIAGLALDHLEGAAREAKVAEGRAYLRLAEAILAPRPAPVLMAVGGLSGSGKSTLARGLAAATGAVVLRSDAIRKGMHGVDETDRLPPEAYTPEASARVYAEMRARSARVLAAGRSAVLDAVHLRPEERDAAAALAPAGVAFAGFWLEASVDRLAARIEARRGDASDATPAVLARQAEHDTGPIRWHRPGPGTPDAVLAAARALLPLGAVPPPV